MRGTQAVFTLWFAGLSVYAFGFEQQPEPGSAIVLPILTGVMALSWSTVGFPALGVAVAGVPGLVALARPWVWPMVRHDAEGRPWEPGLFEAPHLGLTLAGLALCGLAGLLVWRHRHPG
ncbi:MAG: hypothetical protein KC613_10590 [Myxococcales bacterium]|nr:hypothetical protein [Myxococcales bacterium]